MREELFKLIDTDWLGTFQKLKELGLSEHPTVIDLKKQFISPPSNVSIDDIRVRLKIFLTDYIDNDTTFKSQNSWHLSQVLIAQDFSPQKKELNEYRQLNKKVCCAVIQIEPDCGIEYFIMHRHPDISPKSRKANAISIEVNDSIDQGILRAIAQLIGVALPSNYTYRQLDLSLGNKLLNMLREKPVVLVIYNIELWGQYAWDYITQIAKYFCGIPLDEVEHNLYCYFIHAEPNDLFQTDEDILVLPPVCALTENELQFLLDTYYESFSHCYDQAKLLFTGEKYLSQVIDIFTTHSSYATELNAYFDQRLNFE